jgi:putative phosphoesterase
MTSLEHRLPIESWGLMKIVIISDIHANLEALKSLPEDDYDELWCLGDLVDYGPRPHEVIQWIKDCASVVVRGNHDYAIGFDVDPQCSRPYQHLASETMRYTREVCTNDDFVFLRQLPLQREIVAHGHRFYVVHAAPTDPLFAYHTEDSKLWEREVQWINADFLFVGHTHTPFVRNVGWCTIVNPGSLGQPKTGRPFACYAVWENGEISLKEFKYPVEETSRQIRQMPLTNADREDLIAVLETGGSAVPAHRSAVSPDV